MSEGKIGFLERSPGEESSTRLKSMIAFAAGVIITVLGVFLDSVTVGDYMPAAIMLFSYSLGGTAWQQLMDKKPKEKI